MQFRNFVLAIAKKYLPSKVKFVIKSIYCQFKQFLSYISRQLPLSKKKNLNLIYQLQSIVNTQQQLINSIGTRTSILETQAKQDTDQLINLHNMIWQQTPSHIELMKSMFTEKTSCYNVLFVIVDISLWDVFSSIYTAFANDPHFNAVAIVSPRVDISMSVSYEEMLHFFKDRNINYLPGYSPENDRWLDLTALTPHLIFYTVGSGAYWPEHKIEYMSAITRTCYLPYGFLLVDKESFQYNATFHKAAWRIFCETSFHQQKYQKYHRNKPNKIVLSGYPKFDYYQQNPSTSCANFISPWKKATPTTRKKIIWAPHWTVADISPITCSNFETYYNEFLQYIKKSQNIQWLFKPHPNLMWACEHKDILTKNEFMDYLEQWQNLPNGQVYQLAHYFDYFMTSDALILDSISFIAEYLPTKKPILFLEKPGRPTFNAVAEKLLDTFYKAFCFQDIIDFVEQVVINGKDLLYEKRIQCLKDYFYFPQEGAGVKILNHIKHEFNINSDQPYKNITQEQTDDIIA